MRALLLDSDLFLLTRIRETLRQAGYETHAARDAVAFERLLGECRPAVALINLAARGLDWRAAIAAARAACVPTIAYGPHVDLALLEAARAAGATRVIANAKLAADLPALVARTVQAGPAAQDDGHPAQSAAALRGPEGKAAPARPTTTPEVPSQPGSMWTGDE